MVQQTEQQPARIEVVRRFRSPLMVRVLGGGAILAAIAVGVNQLLPSSPFPKIGDVFSSTITPEETKVEAKTLTIKPINFDCLAIGGYSATGETLVKAHGFDHAARAESTKVISTACANNVDAKFIDGKTDTTANVVTKDVTLNVDSMAFNTQFSEADTKIVDASGGGTELLEGGAQAGDAIIDGACKIVTFGGCDEGVGNPFDAAVKTSREDQAKTEQYLRITILKAVQEQCVAGDWELFKQAIIESYQQQATEQGAPATAIRVHFVDEYGVEVTSTPDFTKKTIQALIDAGAISEDMPDVDIQDTSPTVNCVSDVPPVTAADLVPTIKSRGN